MPRTGTQKDGRLARKALRLAGGNALKAAERLRAEAEAVPANKPGVDGYVRRKLRVADWLSVAGGDALKATERLRAEAEAVSENNAFADEDRRKLLRVVEWLNLCAHGVKPLPRWLQEAINSNDDR